MSDNNGWIKLYRKVWDNPVVTKDCESFVVWVYLLTNATHKETDVWFGGNKITLKPGQLITGRKKIALDTGISESKVRRILETFKIDQQISQQTSNKNRLITIVNWDKYQQIDQQIDQQLTNNRPTTDQQPTTNKNNKEYKECKEVFSDTPKLNEAIISFVDYRKSIHRPMTDNAIRLLVKNLNSMSTSVDEQIDILNQSIMNGWQSILPLKDNKKSNPNFKGRVYDFEKLEKELTEN